MDPIKEALAGRLKNFVAALAEKDDLGEGVELEYGIEDNLSCTLRVKVPNTYGPRYFEFRLKEMV